MRKQYKCQCYQMGVVQCESIIHGLTPPQNCLIFKDETPNWISVSDLPDNDETWQPDLPDKQDKLQDKQKSIQDSVVKFCDAMDKGKKNVANATCNFGNLPDWCKVGTYIRDNKNGYGEVVSIRDDRTSCCISFFSKGQEDFVPGALAKLTHLNVRPYTDEEMKSLVGKILVNKETKDINLVTDYIHEVDEDDPDFHYCTVYVGGENMTAGDLLEDFTIDGWPCGIIVE